MDVYHTSTQWCGLSANLECMSEMCCTRLAEYTGRKNCHFGTIAQFCRAVSSQLRHVSTIGKKLLNIDTSSIRPHNMVNFGLLTAEICWRVWGTPANFNGFRALAALLYSTLVVGVTASAKLCGVEQRAPALLRPRLVGKGLAVPSARTSPCLGPSDLAASTQKHTFPYME